MYAYSKVDVKVRSRFQLRVYDRLTNLIESSQKDYFLITPGSQLLWKNEGGSVAWGGKLKILLNSV